MVAVDVELFIVIGTGQNGLNDDIFFFCSSPNATNRKWVISHYLVLSHETMVCIVRLSMFLLDNALRFIWPMMIWNGLKGYTGSSSHQIYIIK